jgi:hypothetical protein
MFEYKNPFVVTKKRLVEVVDGEGPDSIQMSVKSDGPNALELVIGANYNDRSSCYISREGLGQLIETLKEIHEVM